MHTKIKFSNFKVIRDNFSILKTAELKKTIEIARNLKKQEWM